MRKMTKVSAPPKKRVKRPTLPPEIPQEDIAREDGEQQRHIDLDAALTALYRAKQESIRANDAFVALESQVIDMMQRYNLDRYESETHKATYVQGSTEVVDEVGLCAALGSKLWQTVAPRKLDKQKLTAAVKLGTVKASVVKKYVTRNPNKPYIISSERKK